MESGIKKFICGVLLADGMFVIGNVSEMPAGMFCGILLLFMTGRTAYCRYPLTCRLKKLRLRFFRSGWRSA